MKIKPLLILPLSVLMTSAMAHGSMFDFSSAAGYNLGSLAGQNGWVAGDPGAGPDPFGNVVAGGLSYTGGSVMHNGGDQKLSLLGGANGRVSIGLPTTYTAGSTFYFSFLFNHDSGDNFLWLAFAGGAADDNGQVSAVAQNANVAGSPQPRLRSRVRDSGGGQTQINGTAGTHDLGNNTTRLIVGEVFFGGDSANSTITLWMDPTSTDQLAAPTPIVNNGRIVGVTELNTLWIRKGGNAGEAFVDHILIGDSWDAVVIPEPSTYAALFGMLALGLIAWRRRR